MRTTFPDRADIPKLAGCLVNDLFLNRNETPLVYVQTDASLVWMMSVSEFFLSAWACILNFFDSMLMCFEFFDCMIMHSDFFYQYGRAY